MTTSEDGAGGPPDGMVEAVARAIIRSDDDRGGDYRVASYARAAIAAVRDWDAALQCEATAPAGGERCLLHRGHHRPHRSLYADWRDQ